MKINYLEYAGRFLDGSVSDEQNSPAQLELQQKINEAHALLGILDGRRVLQHLRGEQDGAAYLRASIQPMLGHINATFAPQRPVYLLLTKWDLFRDHGQPGVGDNDKLAQIGRILAADRHMRHPLSTSCSGSWLEGLLPVANVNGLVVGDALHQAVPQDLQPPVRQSPQGGMMAFASADFGVVELTRPPRLGEAAKSPLVHGSAEVAVVGQTTGDDQFTAPGAAGDRCCSGVTLQSAGRFELLDVVSDFAGDPGGEDVPETGEAEIDVTARDRFSRIKLLRLFATAAAGRAQQQFTHPAFPRLPRLTQRQQLSGRQRDGGFFRADQIVFDGQLLSGQGIRYANGEPVWPAVLRGASERLDVLTAGRGEVRMARPAGQHLEHDRGTEIIAGDHQRGRERRQQVRAQPIQQTTFVAGGAFIVAGDSTQLPGQLAVRDQLPQLQELVQGHEAADSRVFGVVFLLRRATTTRHKVRVDRQQRETRVRQRLDEYPVPGFQHNPDFGRVSFQFQASSDQPVDTGDGVVDTELLDHSFPRLAQRHVVERLGPINAHTEHVTRLLSGSGTKRPEREALHRADRPVLIGTTSSKMASLRLKPPRTPSHVSPRRTSDVSVPRRSRP